MQTTNDWIALIVGIVLAAAGIAAVLIVRRTRKRHVELRQRFGVEYDREVEERGSVAKAERELLSREKRVFGQDLRELPEAERIRFDVDWRNVQTQFVDDPARAVQAADQLIKTVMLARGYEVERFDQRVADLSVEHAAVVQHYRAAHELAAANREGRANTEELRQALVHYRSLFADLLEQHTGVPPRLEDTRNWSPG
jgi:hypothetical protein